MLSCAAHVNDDGSSKSLMNLGRFEIADGRLNEAPRLGGFEIASTFANLGMAGRFAHSFAAMDEDDLAREIDKVLHVRLPSFAVLKEP
jgi:hypothetical protein